MLLKWQRSIRAALGAGLLAIVATACPSPGPNHCTNPYDGDESAPMQAELVGLTPDADAEAMPLTDGGPLYIYGAPQGGYVIYAGAYLKNFSVCDVTLAAELIAPDGGGALTNSDSRQALFGGTGLAGYSGPSDLYSDLPNIPACPDALGGNIAGTPAILRVVATDDLGKSATFEMNVLPSCPPNDGACLCECGGQCN